MSVRVIITYPSGRLEVVSGVDSIVVKENRVYLNPADTGAPRAPRLRIFKPSDYVSFRVEQELLSHPADTE